MALGLRPELLVTGDDFPTKDKSAMRDYIHVSDLVDAHVQLMFALKENDLLYYNVGNGKPYTVLEIVEVARKVSGRKIPVVMKPARPGDPPILYTDPKKIRKSLLASVDYHEDTSDGTEYAIAVKVFAYHGGHCAVWVYFGLIDTNLLG